MLDAPEKQETGQAGNQCNDVMRHPKQRVQPGSNLFVPPVHVLQDPVAEFHEQDGWQQIQAGDSEQSDSDQ
jgi:hypothetical protein